MFYQYLRGRASELRAVESIVKVLKERGNVFPIVEPVLRDLKLMARVAETLVGNGARIAVVSNPSVGELKTSRNILTDAQFNRVMHFPAFVPAFILGPSTTDKAVNAFVKKYSDRGELCFVHLNKANHRDDIASQTKAVAKSAVHVFMQGMDRQYIDAFKAKQKVVLVDGFRQMSNAEYEPDEEFSSVKTTFAKDSWDGFGDFSIVGSHYRKGGGRPMAVTIHLTYQRDDQSIGIRHFVSDRKEDRADTEGKFMESVSKLYAFVTKQGSVHETSAVHEFKSLYASQHFPGLPKLKEISIRHHMELMTNLLPPATTSA